MLAWKLAGHVIYCAHSVKGRSSLRHKISAILIAFVLLLAAGQSWAHHSPSAVFDMSKEFTLTGTLTKVDWINPHIVVYLDAKKDDGSVENWKFESNPPSWFRRVSLGRDDFAKAIGQNVTVEGVHAKAGGLYGYLLKITFPDGNSLELVFKPTANAQ
jgi:hypothetical protein